MTRQSWILFSLIGAIAIVLAVRAVAGRHAGTAPPAPAFAVVPNVTGRPTAAARAALREAGFLRLRVCGARDPVEGTVPAANVRIATTTRVEIDRPPGRVACAEETYQTPVDVPAPAST